MTELANRSNVLLALFLTACVTPSMSDDDVAKLADERTRATCGATISLVDGDLSGTGLYAIGAYPEPGRGEVLDHVPSLGEIRAFVAKHRPLLAAPKHALGTFCEGAGGRDCKAEGARTCYLDVTRVTANLDAAASLARACNQKSIARLHRDGIEIIASADGRPFGNGQPLAGAALSGCERARQSR